MRDCPLSSRGVHNWKPAFRDKFESFSLCEECGEWSTEQEAMKHTESKISGASNADYDTKVIEEQDCPPNTMFFIKKNQVTETTWNGLVERYNELHSISPRAEILEEARQAVLQDRNLDYGDPEDNFRDIARMANIMFAGVTEFTSVHAAIMGLIIKMSRLKTSPNKKDHWVDIAGYAACGWECVVNEQIRNTESENAQGYFDFGGVSEGADENSEMQ